ncbi:MAG: hypothetical protein ABR551_06435 [Gemmatimonadales bacterium]
MRFLLRARVAPWLVWSAVLAVLASPLAGAAEHCAHPLGAEATPVASHAHTVTHGEHHSETEDSSEAAECPHCPPTQCGTQLSCSATGAELVAQARSVATRVAAVQVPSAASRQPISAPSAPPTPPPQLFA